MRLAVCERGALDHRRDREIPGSNPLFVGQAQQQIGKKLAVQFKIPRRASWILQISGDLVAVGNRGKRLLGFRNQKRRSAAREFLKNRNHQWHAVVKDSRAAFEDRLGIFRQGEQESGSWRACVDPVTESRSRRNPMLRLNRGVAVHWSPAYQAVSL